MDLQELLMLARWVISQEWHPPEDRAADRKTALTILGKSFLLAAIATGVVLVLPF